MFDGDDPTSGDDESGERLAPAYREPDPEADWPDPETELPSVPTPPSVEIPRPDSTEEDAPAELVAGFWTTVVVINVALFATSLGLLLLAFGVQRRLAIGALVVGAVAAVHGYLKYRSLAERKRRGEWAAGGSGGTDGSGGDDARAGAGPDDPRAGDGPADARAGDGPADARAGDRPADERNG